MNLINYYKKGILFIIKSPILFIKYFLLGLKTLLITLPNTLIEKITIILNIRKFKEYKYSFSIEIPYIHVILYML